MIHPQLISEALERVLEDTPLSICLTTLDGKFVYVNSFFLKLSGYQEVEIVGKDYSQIGIWKNLEDRGKLIDALDDNGVVSNFETIHCMKFGKEVPVSISAKIVEIENEKYAVSWATDRSSSVQIENQLYNLESIFYTALNTIPEPVAISRANDGMFLYVNPAFAKLYGYEKEELVGFKSTELDFWKHSKDREEFIKCIDTYGFVNNFETILLSKHGDDIPVTTTSCFIDVGDQKCLVAWAIDRRPAIEADFKNRQLEAQLLQSEKMKALGQLTGGIAHDFNNILQVMLGYCQLAKEKGDKNKPEEYQEYLDLIYDTGIRAREMIEKMMLFGRISPAHSKRQSLQRITENMMSMLEHMIPSNIHISAQYDGKIPDVIVDPVQVEQVIMNLCINARDSMKQSGIIDIHISQQSFKNNLCNSCHESFNGFYVVMSIKDNGSGISKSKIESIFKPFFTTKDVGEGTGMGLAMVHGIIHNYGGHCMVQSSLGDGTTFKLLFPVPEESSMPVQDKMPVSDLDLEELGIGREEGEVCQQEKTSGNILIVDDEPAIATYLDKYLTLHGYNTLTSTSAKEALDILRENDVSLVLSDLSMPETTGLELTEKIRNDYPDLRVIICSGNLSIEDQDKAGEAGVNAYLTKPIDTGEMLRKINEQLSKN